LSTPESSARLTPGFSGLNPCRHLEVNTIVLGHY
jgi:hypothetical protein